MILNFFVKQFETGYYLPKMLELLLFSRSAVSDSLRPHALHAAHQASLSFTISRSLLKLMSIESVMPSNHLMLCPPLLLLPSIFPRIRVFSSESVLRIRWPEYWSFSFTSVLPMNTQDLFLFGLTGLISLQFERLSRVFPNTTVVKHKFFSLLYGPTLTSIDNYWKNHSFD